jgi:hypothetical protein
MNQPITFKEAFLKITEVVDLVFDSNEYWGAIIHLQLFLIQTFWVLLRILAVLTFPISFPLLALLYKKVYNDKYEEFKRKRESFNNR